MDLDSKGKVIIFHAGSLSRPLKAMDDSFSVLHPGIRLVFRARGSAELARLIALRKMGPLPMEPPLEPATAMKVKLPAALGERGRLIFFFIK